MSAVRDQSARSGSTALKEWLPLFSVLPYQVKNCWVNVLCLSADGYLGFQVTIWFWPRMKKWTEWSNRWSYSTRSVTTSGSSRRPSSSSSTRRTCSKRRSQSHRSPSASPNTQVSMQTLQQLLKELLNLLFYLDFIPLDLIFSWFAYGRFQFKLQLIVNETVYWCNQSNVLILIN